MYADLVLMNGKIVTVDPEERIAEAVAVKFGRILEVGSDGDIKPLIGSGTVVVDLEGMTVLPGFIDTHGHLFSSGIGLGHIDCSEEAGVRSIRDIQERITERAKRTPKGGWIVGDKFDESKLAERRIPNRWDLDAAAPEHPVLLSMVGGHIYVANSRALEVKGITRETPDPLPGGRFERDPVTGELTGIIYERAVDLVRPEPSYEEVLEGIRRMSREYVSAGITCFYDSYITGREVRAYLELRGRGGAPPEGEVGYASRYPPRAGEDGDIGSPRPRG